jgi:hypothetical protein
LNHHPRIYDVPGEKLALRVWDGEPRVCECCGHRPEGRDLWFSMTWGELRNLTQDGQDALFRQMRALEKG